MYCKQFILTIILSAFCGLLLNAQPYDKSVHTDPEIIRGFMDKRFGMFIHWGPVSLRGTEIGWSRGREVSKEDYDNLYKEFNPVLFDATDWEVGSASCRERVCQYGSSSVVVGSLKKK